MTNWQRYLGQAVLYGLFLAFIGALSNWPPYTHIEADEATIKLSLRHPGERLEECRTRSTEEIAHLAKNMRNLQDCPRERSPLFLELELNNEVVFSKELSPRGLHNDGLASAYQRLTVPAGTHDITVRMKDHLEQESYPYQSTQSVTLSPAQVLVIDFDSKQKIFDFL